VKAYCTKEEASYPETYVIFTIPAWCYTQKRPKKFHLIAIRLQESHMRVKSVECTLTLGCRELNCENITVVSSLDHGRVQCHSL